MPTISTITDVILQRMKIALDILRLDLLHPYISGNKWYKLQYNLQEAKQLGHETLLSFGGAYSNHLHALAFAGKEYGFRTIGLVRGENVTNPTLDDCRDWGMQLDFISREDYRQKNEAEFLSQVKHRYPDAYIIPEGGANALGIKGCEDILNEVQQDNYTHLACAVGTGTTLCGLLNSRHAALEVMGFSAIKNGQYLNDEIALHTRGHSVKLYHDYHFGGFAKSTLELQAFMLEFNRNHHIPLDRVYTGKMMYGLFKEIEKGTIAPGSRILAIHTGGLQGNRS